MSAWRNSSGSSLQTSSPARGDDFLARLDERFRRPLVAYFEKRIRESYEVDDLVQEVFVRLARRSHFESIEYVEGYVFQTAANVIRDRLRRRAAQCAGEHDALEEAALPADDLSPERVLQGKQLLDRAVQALQKMPARTRQVFILRRYEGMKQEEIAAYLHISVSGVRLHLQRARAHLARLMERDS
jgi:RNA polymerase sigma factor (sigma-70 family)